MAIKAIPVKYQIGSDFDDNQSPIFVERTHETMDTWAIRRPAGVCLNRYNEWEWEPMPSSRDNEFLQRTRFPFDVAVHLAETQYEKEATT